MYRSIICLQIDVGMNQGLSTPLLADVKYTIFTNEELTEEGKKQFYNYGRNVLESVWFGTSVARNSLGLSIKEFESKDDIKIDKFGCQDFITTKIPYSKVKGVMEEYNKKVVSSAFRRKLTFEFYSEVEPDLIPIQRDNVGNNMFYRDRTQIYRVLWDMEDSFRYSGRTYCRVRIANPILYKKSLDLVFGYYFKVGDIWIIS